MNRILKLLVLLVINTRAVSASAQVSFSSLQEVWEYAAKNNIQLQVAAANKLIADKNIQQANGDRLPTLALSGGYTDNQLIQKTLVPAHLFNPAAPLDTYSEVTFGRRYLYSASIIAQFDIINMEDWFNVKAAKINEQIAGLNIAKTKMDLYQQLANAYFSCILLSEAEKLSLDNVKAATDIYTISNNKFKDGLVSEVTVNMALINKEKAGKSLSVATQNKTIQLNNLKLLLNSSDSIAITEKIIEKDFINDTAQFAPDPIVLLAYNQLMLSKNNWQSTKAAFAPTLSAVYQFSSQVAADDFLKFNNSNTVPLEYWGLRLSVPIFAGNTRRYQVQKAKIDYSIRQKQLDNAKLQSSISNQNLLIAYNGSLNTFQKSKSILKLYQSNDAHAARRMTEGVISLDERLRSFADLLDNQNEYLQSLSDYFIQAYSLQLRQTNLTK